jgi:hypothetical protein
MEQMIKIRTDNQRMVLMEIPSIMKTMTITIEMQIFQMAMETMEATQPS